MCCMEWPSCITWLIASKLCIRLRGRLWHGRVCGRRYRPLDSIVLGRLNITAGWLSPSMFSDHCSTDRTKNTAGIACYLMTTTFTNHGKPRSLFFNLKWSPTPFPQVVILILLYTSRLLWSHQPHAPTKIVTCNFKAPRVQLWGWPQHLEFGCPPQGDNITLDNRAILKAALTL